MQSSATEHAPPASKILLMVDGRLTSRAVLTWPCILIHVTAMTITSARMSELRRSAVTEDAGCQSKAVIVTGKICDIQLRIFVSETAGSSGRTSVHEMGPVVYE